MTSCIGIVLAGGQSRRMGQDKAKLKRNNTEMLSISKQLLLDTGVQEVLISGSDYDVQDIYPQLGPMGGIYSSLQHIAQLGKACEGVLILPVDLPLLTSKTLQQLKTVGELSGKATYFNTHSLPLYLPLNAYVDMFFQQAFQATTLKVNKESCQTNVPLKDKADIKSKARLLKRYSNVCLLKHCQCHHLQS